MQHWVRFVFFFCVALVSACSSAPSPRSPATPVPVRDVDLERTLAGLASEVDGTVAVSVLHLGDGRRASLRGDARLPMMSVFKLPLALVALSMVEERALRLEQPIPIAESELRPGVSPLEEEWRRGVRSPTLETMLVRVLQDSDNTAGDKLVSLEGGGDAIMQRMRTLGIAGVEIREQEIEIAARVQCPGAASPPGGWTYPALEACAPAPAEVHRAAAEHEVAHAPNAASADALVSMLASFERGELLADRSRSWLHHTLAGTKTGRARIPALLPAGTRVEHRTGTGNTVEGMTIAVNDIGLVALPNGQRFAIAVLVAGSGSSVQTLEALIARMARATWDHFVR